MFAVFYLFEVHPGRDNDFVAAWTVVTEGLREAAGSYGSCLHRISDGHYAAYARWPSRAAWQADHDLPLAVVEALGQMRACCASIETRHELEVLVDRLVLG